MAQEKVDEVKQIIESLFYDPKMYSRLFFDYDGVGKVPFVLPQGRYAFISPDSAILKAYPEIEESLAYTWPNEHKLFTLTYIEGDRGTIYVTKNWLGDSNIRWMAFFDQINIEKSKAELSFRIKSRYANSKYVRKDVGKRYTWVKAYLKRQGERWILNKCKIVEPGE